MKKQRKLLDVLVFVFLAVGSIFMLYPFIWMIFTSFKPKMHIYLGGLLPKVWDFSSYVQIWSEIPLVRGFLNTILYSVPPVFIGSLVSVAAAFAFAKINFRGKNVIFLLLLSAIMVPFPTIMIPQFVHRLLERLPGAHDLHQERDLAAGDGHGRQVQRAVRHQHARAAHHGRLGPAAGTGPHHLRHLPEVDHRISRVLKCKGVNNRGKG